MASVEAGFGVLGSGLYPSFYFCIYFNFSTIKKNFFSNVLLHECVFLQNVRDSWASFKCSRDALFPSRSVRFLLIVLNSGTTTWLVREEQGHSPRSMPALMSSRFFMRRNYISPICTMLAHI